MRPIARVARLAGRIALLGSLLGVAAVVAIQFEGIVMKNVAIAAELRASNDRIAALGAREARQRRTLARLSNPVGAIPEIHDKLNLVGPNEEIIFLRGAASDSQSPRTWDDSE